MKSTPCLLINQMKTLLKIILLRPSTHHDVHGRHRQDTKIIWLQRSFMFANADIFFPNRSYRKKKKIQQQRCPCIGSKYLVANQLRCPTVGSLLEGLVRKQLQ